MTEHKKRVILITVASVLVVVLIVLLVAIGIKGCNSTDTEKESGTQISTDKNDGEEDGKDTAGEDQTNNGGGLTVADDEEQGEDSIDVSDIFGDDETDKNNPSEDKQDEDKDKDKDEDKDKDKDEDKDKDKDEDDSSKVDTGIGWGRLF